MDSNGLSPYQVALQHRRRARDRRPLLRLPWKPVIHVVILAVGLTLALSTQIPASAFVSGQTYMIEPGDTLTRIAAATGISVPCLAAANNLSDPDVIRAGDVMNIPALSPSTQTYCVKRGDTLTSISAATAIPVDCLARLNDLANPDAIRAGQALLLAPPAYRVKPGDTLSSISRTAGIPAHVLADWNGLPDPDRLLAGQSLRLSGSPASGDPTGACNPITWIGSENYWDDRPYGGPIAIVLHTSAGSLGAIDHWFSNPQSQVSAHFAVGLDGRTHQYVDLADRAWGEGNIEPDNVWPGPEGMNPNHYSVSIETEDGGNPPPPVTEAQYQAAVRAGRLILREYPNIQYLVSHRAIAPHARANDPGPRWVATGRFEALAAALGLKPIP
ncbi:MAG: LysM peptidoglycan-binding domain-containing protein [Chloroflexi bacterium]|nr:LysM peptidoglycan-binding domain-containing protein [Chloroflexota bacterium]